MFYLLEGFNMTYQINGWIRFSEEDSYGEGCLPNTGTMYSDNQVFKSDSLDDLLPSLLDFTGADINAVELNACGDIGRIDISILEDENSSFATMKQIEQWKKGEIKLWNSLYTFNANTVESTPVDFGEVLI
jgi:hypothetical protein